MSVGAIQAQPLRLAFGLSLFSFASILGCATPPEAPLAPADVAGVLSAREPRLAADIADLSGLAPLALPRPTPEELADPSCAGYWRACAWAWNPLVRAARRELAAALANSEAAGSPEALALGVENEDLEQPGDETKLTLSFDLLGLAGLGPSSRARESARAQVHRARSAFERSLWDACFEVERARVQLAAAQARLQILSGFLALVEHQESRVEILERRGRLSEVEAQVARLAGHEIDHAISRENASIAALRGELATRAGLLPLDPALSSAGPELLELAGTSRGGLEAVELLEGHPRLRELRSEYALAEAQVREIASEAWPKLRAGPIFRFVPSDVLFGGLLDVDLPWPGSVEPRVRAALQEREAARERLEDELLAALVLVARLREELSEARARSLDHSVQMEETASSVLDAVNQRLPLGGADYFEWTMRLREAQMAALALIDERAGARLLELELEQARGVSARATEVAP